METEKYTIRDHVIETKNQKEFEDVRQVLRDLGEPIYEETNKYDAKHCNMLSYYNEEWCRVVGIVTITAEEFIKQYKPKKDTVSNLTSKDVNMSDNLISMDKKYKTRDGRDVTILHVDRKHRELPVVALIDNGHFEGVETYTNLGKYNVGGSKSDLDLIEVKPKVKYLKSIRQILEEFPDADFDEDGNLGCAVWNNKISHEMLRYFGNPLSDTDRKRWSYIPEWIEEREV